MNNRATRIILLATSSLAAQLLNPAMAQAQSAPASAPDTAAAEPDAKVPDAKADADIVVTGSRLASGFAMPTPVTTLSNADMQKLAPSSLAEGLKQVPALSGSVASSSSGTGSAGGGTNGQSTLNLRGLGAQRTLVLLDGARMGVTNVLNSVDINIIPQNLIKRVDIVTGGASASYGSDAVAGVVNFILDSRFEGFKAELSGGVTSRGDGENGRLSLAFGTKIGESTRLVASAEFFRMGGIPYGKTGRKWFDDPVGVWPNAVAGANPKTLTLPGTRAALASYGGTIASIAGCPQGSTGDQCRGLAGQQFLAGGAIAPFDNGTSPGTSFTSGGDGAIATNGLTPSAKRESLFAHIEHDVSGDVTLWAEGVYARNYTRNAAQPSRESGSTAYTIYEDNAYLPKAVADILAATPGTQSFKLARYDIDLPLVTVYGISKVLRFAGGAKGALWPGWSFDTTLAYQSSLQKLDVYNSIPRNIYAAADAVKAPGGQVVCRSTLAGLDPGCVPMNLFGTDTLGDDVAAYVMGLNTGHTRLNQATFDLNVRGDLGEGFNLGAGPVTTAMGVSYRRLTARRTVDALSAIYLDGTGVRGFPTGLQGRYGGYTYYNPSPLAGKVNVSEAYLELGVPLLKDQPLFQALDLTLAGRLTDYSQSGLEPMWKVGVNWAVNDDIRLRGTISADTRAPTVLELFNSATVTKAVPLLPWSGAAVRISGDGQIVTQGNPALNPEHARTYTAGVVFSPTFIPGFQASVDYYRISLKNSILAFGAQDIIDRCYAGDQTFCSQLKVNGQPITTTTGITTTDFVTITTQGINYARESTSGLDIEAAYKMALGDGQLTLRGSGNYLLTAKVQNQCTGTIDAVGNIGNCGSYPRFRGRLSANYEIGRFSFYVQERYISGGVKDKTLTTGTDITENRVPRTFYTDLNIDYDVGKIMGGELEAFVNVTNLFDQAPRNTLSRGRAWVEPSDLSIYDALGARFVAGFRFRM